VLIIHWVESSGDEAMLGQVRRAAESLLRKVRVKTTSPWEGDSRSRY
jgi:hypothetical protein